MTEVVQVTHKEHWESLLDTEADVVLRFTAEWCQPCKRFAPAFDAAAERHPATFAVVDIDKVPELAVEYGVMGIPAVKQFTDGEFKRDLAVNPANRTPIKFLEELNSL